MILIHIDPLNATWISLHGLRANLNTSGRIMTSPHYQDKWRSISILRMDMDSVPVNVITLQLRTPLTCTIDTFQLHIYSPFKNISSGESHQASTQPTWACIRLLHAYTWTQFSPRYPPLIGRPSPPPTVWPITGSGAQPLHPLVKRSVRTETLIANNVNCHVALSG